MTGHILAEKEKRQNWNPCGILEKSSHFQASGSHVRSQLHSHSRLHHRHDVAVLWGSFTKVRGVSDFSEAEIPPNNAIPAASVFTLQQPIQVWHRPNRMLSQRDTDPLRTSSWTLQGSIFQEYHRWSWQNSSPGKWSASDHDLKIESV